MSSVHHITKEYQVVVVGGGLSGMCAAIAAARGGAKTALVQNRSMLGGNASSEIRMHIVGANCHNSKPDLMESGILLEMLLENKRRNPYHTFPIWDMIMWEKVRFEENLDLYLNTCLEKAQSQAGNINEITCYQNTTETLFTFKGDIFIDATGHGTLGVLAGAQFRMGSEGKAEFNEPNAPDEPNQTTMGNTLLFQAVKRDRPVEFIKPHWAYTFSEDDLKYRTHIDQVHALADMGEPAEFVAGENKNLPEFYNLDSGYWWIELGGQYDDIVAQGEEIRDELTKCVYGVWDHIKNVEDHGAQYYDLEWVGFIPGYRESRRLEGDYFLNERDIRENRVFDDAVAYGGWPMDEHVRGGIMDFDKRPSRIFNFEGSYTIPYRCFYSKDVENLMMAGRNISTSKMAFGSTRVMGTCAVGGQAAGMAAAMAVAKGLKPKEMLNHIGELQQALLKQDCYIPGFSNQDPADVALTAKASASSSLNGCEAKNVISGVTRRVGKDENCWESAPLNGEEAWLRLDLEEEKALHQIRLTFDPNLSREIMPSITATVRNRQGEGMPRELVKNYKVVLQKGGTSVFEKEVRNNYQRVNIIDLPEETLADSAVVYVKDTHGHPGARIFEIRLY